MSGSKQELEERIRRALDQAARQLQVDPLPWQHTPSLKRRWRVARPNWGDVVPVMLVVVALAIGAAALVLLRHTSAQPGSPSSRSSLPSAPAAAFLPHLSGREGRYITAAWRATVARDPACRPPKTPELTTGQPSRQLTSWFAILRRPTTRAERLQALLHDRSAYGPRATLGGLDQELYLNQIRLARTASGASFYVIPAGNASGQRGVPARCGPEQVASLKREMAGLSWPRRTQILRAQRRYLAYLRYQALHPEGICATFVPAGAARLDLADNLGCATLADVGRWGVAFDGDASVPGGPVFWTVVPDAVKTVTVRFHLTATARPRTIATTVRPIRNVVVLAERHGVTKSGKAKTYWAAGFPSTIVLRDAGGEVLKRISVTPNMITLCGYGC